MPPRPPTLIKAPTVPARGAIGAHEEDDAQREHAQHPEIDHRRHREHGQQEPAVPPGFEALGDLPGHTPAIGPCGSRLGPGPHAEQAGC